VLNNLCEDLINQLVNQGAIIIQDKQEGENIIFGRIVKIKKGNCMIKISYINLGEKQLVVQETCQCEGQQCWKNIPKRCLNGFL
jgi:hypothetical protein